ncbi:hypothetical protein [Clostridium magnum]|uniref:Uncharacterized protein n=1 Tax=Clostridium magnum DSM 2767 TaxID=1121326 RepID=A0A161WQX3_9CLOT|nr:hypothetical protein [Clostridium magnum]KZL89098.1 hypothetical protein CLMAG_55840 [Clostridium magnum DSM 2767]SHI29233.1 hypothetical protein SAMN02745944_04048 [Clostridium magnum DSM 2767]
MESPSLWTANDLEILQMIAETIAAKITSQNKVSKALGELKREFVIELLLGKITNETMAYNQAVSLGWNTKKYFSVLEVIDSRDSYIEKKAAYICSELKNYLASVCIPTALIRLISY